jgi:hypothetical protein
MPSIPARRSAMMARVAMAPPMEALVNGLPLLPMTTVRKQYVGGDHHAARACLLRNPVIRRIETVRHNDPGDQRMVGHTKARIADQYHGHIPAPGDLVNLLLHRTRIGIDQYAG